MAEDATAGTSVEQLEATIAAQQAELEELRGRLRGPATSRRTLLKGAGVVGAGLAALTAVNSGTGGVGRPEVAGAIEGHNVKYGAASRVWLEVTGSKSGKFPGTSASKVHASQMECGYFQQKVVTPRDTSGGLATGRSMFDAVVVRKKIDRNTPVFSRAQLTNEPLTSVVFSFYDTDSVGSEVLTFRVTLGEAFVGAHNVFSPEVGEAGTSTAVDLELREELAFAFGTIQWEHVPTGTVTAWNIADSSSL